MGDPGKINYRPGAGTVIGGASPMFNKLLGEYFTLRRQQQAAGQPVELSIEDFVNWIKKGQNLSQQEVDFLTGKTNVPPHNSPYRLVKQRIWTKGNFDNFMENVEYHGNKHLPEFSEIYPQDYTYYGNVAHNFRGELPTGAELKITPEGQRLYYHEPSNTFMVQDKNGTMQSIYKPKSGRKWFDDKKGIYYGKIR